MVPSQKTARVAGLLFLLVVASDFFHLLYVPSRLLVLAEASVPFSFANMLNKMAILPLLQVAAHGGSEAAAAHNQIMQYLQRYHEGNAVAQIFWGLWLLPLGYLLIKSGFVPRALGWLLLAGGAG